MNHNLNHNTATLILAFILAAAFPALGQAQAAGDAQAPADTVYSPPVIYSPLPKSYEIAGIKVSGVKNVEDYVVITTSGLSIGERIEIPGTAISNAVKRFWRTGLYSKVQIKLDKVAGDKAWLEIVLAQQPRLSEVRYTGVKSGEKKDISERLAMVSGQQITPNIIARAKDLIQKYYDAKGFKNAQVTVRQVPDLSKENQVFMDVDVVKSNKTKVHKIYIAGNKELSDKKIKGAMKKTNENGNLLNLFKQKKFVTQDYHDDLARIIQKYNEYGFRDAKILKDSVVQYDENKVDVYIDVEEGKKYYISDITWAGNTVYDTDVLNELLGIYPGDVYNQKMLNKRTTEDDDAVANLYLDNGYLFFNLVPIEENVKGDSVALQMRVIEGPQAKINRVVINGNDRLYEKVIRRELRVKPGELFSKNDLMRSAREIASTGHFNPETMDIRPEPNENDGTVDIIFNLESKANDKIQFSFGWGQTGITGQLALSFTNFSIRNLFHPSTYRGLIQ